MTENNRSDANQQRAWDKFPNMRPNITSDAEDRTVSFERYGRREEVEY